MKKIILAVLMISGIFTMVSADIGLNIGVSAQVGSMEASGKEVSSDGTTETSKTREALFGTGGFFIEKDLAFLPGRLGTIGSRIHLGYDNTVNDLDLGTVNNARAFTKIPGVAATDIGEQLEDTNHSLNAKISGFTTTYATINITDWLYVKAGNVDVDIDTEFKGTTTSSYANKHSLDGKMYGFGLQKTSDNGLFFRAEYNDYSIDGKSVVNAGADSKFTATLNDVDGTTGKILIGKAF